MNSFSTIAEARRRLSRLDRKDENGVGLSTVDPLMADIMIANTLSNLAVAEALREQTEQSKKAYEAIALLPYTGNHKFEFHNHYHAIDTSENKSILESIHGTLKDLVKMLRSKLK